MKQLPFLIGMWILAFSYSVHVAADQTQTDANNQAVEANVQQTPDDVVASVTDSLLSVAKSKGALLDSGPEAYFSEVRSILEPAVDFEFIAKNVMGRRYWTSVASDDQQAFVQSFSNSLIETYGRGMAAFADLDIRIASSRPSEKSDQTHYVVQSVKNNDGTNNVVYTMRLTEHGWMLRNVVLNGVNLGKTFKSQFAQAVKDNNNSVEQAIANWAKPQS